MAEEGRASRSGRRLPADAARGRRRGDPPRPGLRRHRAERAEGLRRHRHSAAQEDPDAEATSRATCSSFAGARKRAAARAGEITLFKSTGLASGGPGRGNAGVAGAEVERLRRARNRARQDSWNRARSRGRTRPPCPCLSKSAGCAPPRRSMRRWRPAPTWSDSCSSRRRRAISMQRPRGPWASGCNGRARKVALSVDATDPELRQRSEALQPDLLQLHGKEPPERVVGGALALSSAGDEGAADREPRRSRADPHLRKVADRLLFDARAPREATRPGGLGKPFDWHLLESIDRGGAVHAVGRARRRQCRRGAAYHARASGRRLFRRRARAGREGPGTRFAPSFAPRAKRTPRSTES